MRFSVKLAGVVFLSSAALGWMTSPLLKSANEQLEADRSVESLSSLSGGLGGGISIATLGGYRTIAANLVWISMYGDWQYRRAPEVLSKMKLAVSLNPDSEFYWIDGARIIANDMPVWQVGDESMASLFETEAGGEVRRQYGERALAFLDSAPRELQDNVPILVEKGTISWRKLGDLDQAIRYFGEAIRQPRAPYYVSRVYAELLIRNGQLERAYAFLVEHIESLPDDEPTAMKQQVARRIADLQLELSGKVGEQ